MAKLTTDQLKSVITNESAKCIGLPGDTLSTARADLKSRFLRMSYAVDEGLSQKGWSTFVDGSVSEVVHAAQAAMVKVFGSGDEIVRCDPVGAEDEEAAKDASDYINKVIFAKNADKLILDTLTDGLYQRCGWAKAWVDEREETDLEKWTGLSGDQASALVLSLGENDVQVEREGKDEDAPFRVTARVKRKKNDICIEPVPPENVFISGDARSVETARFVCHWEHVTRSDLLKEGYKRDLVNSIPVAEGDEHFPEKAVQASVNDSQAVRSSADTSDPAGEMVRKVEAWLWADVNGDGIQERVKVVYGGDDSDPIVLEWEEWAECRPPLFAACSSPLPHSVVGLCVADKVLDIQRGKSELYRYFFDNLYLSNQGEIHAQVSQGSDFDESQLLDRRPGGVYFSTGDVQLEPLPIGNSAPQALAGLEMLDKAREMRTGIGLANQGIAADALQNTAAGAMIAEEAQNISLEFVARVYAKHFFAPLGRYVLRLLNKYQNQEIQVRLRGRPMRFDPRTWDPDWDVSIAVGLGTGNRGRLVQTLAAVSQAQERFMKALGPMSPVKIHHAVHTMHKMLEASGVEAPEQYFGTIEDAKAAEQAIANRPPQPDPKTQEAQARLQLEQQKAQAQMQLNAQKMQQDAALERRKQDMSFALKREEIQAETALDAQRQAMGEMTAATANIRQAGGI